MSPVVEQGPKVCRLRSVGSESLTKPDILVAIEEAGSMTIRDEELEAEARALLRERIERTPWFKIRVTREQRRVAIEREVDRNWHLLVPEAAKRLVERAARGSPERP
jgi:hypothetical protein